MQKERFFTPLLLVLMVLSFTLALSEFIIIGILDSISNDVGESVSVMGLLISVYAIAYAIGTPIMTSLLSRFDEYKIMLTMTGIFAVCNLVMVFSNEYFGLLFARIITAVSSGVVMSMALVIAVRHSKPENANRTVTWMFAGFSVASVAGLPLGVLISEYFGWTMIFVLVVAMILVLMLMMVFVLPHDNKGHDLSVGNIDTKGLLKDKRIILGILVAAFSIAGIFSFYSYLSPILIDVAGISSEDTSIVFFVYGLACIVGNMVSAKLADRYGFGMFPLVFILEIIIMILLMPAMASSVIIGTGILMVVGAMIYVVNTTNQTHFIEIAVREYPAATNLSSSLNTVSFNIGIAAGSALGSLIIAVFGLEYVGYAGAICIVGALISVLILNKIEKNPELHTSVSKHI